MLSKLVFAQQSTRLFSRRIIVSNLPLDMDRTAIHSRFSIVGPLQNVQLVMNTQTDNFIGQAILTFKEDKAGLEAIDKFNNQEVDNITNNLKPYGDIANSKESLISRRLYLLGLCADVQQADI